MASIFVNCFRDMAVDSNNRLISAPLMPALAEQSIEITDHSIAGDPFPAYTRFIAILPETDCCIAIGEDPEADPDYHLILEGERVFYGVHEGHRLAVIDYISKDEFDAFNDEK